MNFMVCMFALCMVVVGVAGSVNSGEANQRKKVILDTDTGTGIVGEEVDDGLALLLALASPELDLIGVTEVHGNVNVDQGVANALLILELVGRDDIPVYADLCWSSYQHRYRYR